MPTLSFHPATRLACWALLVLTIQCLGGAALALAFAPLPLLGRPVLRHWLRLLRRTRWLLLSLAAILGWSVAGEPLWEGAVAAPTAEGLLEAATQGGRLALVLAAVAVLLETTPVPTLMAGCHGLLQPLRALGVDVRRVVARLMLTLHYAETLPPVSRWRDLLAGRSASDAGAAPPVRFAPGRYGAADVAAVGACAALFAVALLA